MSGPVNLRRARKERERARKRAQGDQNAAKHGRSKLQRAQETAEAEAARRRLDGHERERE